MRISEFAERTGISTDTIRYYEKIKLLQPAKINKQRDYSIEDLETVETIIKLKDTGFTLQEIKLLFDWSHNAEHTRKLTEEETENIRQIQVLFQEKYNDILRKEERIKEMKQVLHQANQKMDYLLKKNKKY
ncbi:MerR family transcriptional regulator [Ornithinibacillus halotolerans]|uniref:MerR family transcriptional regulator n=1 Tax=Ornithinibacillus halotolerans TaxID=1274357 RepID=A0A916W631_9BACI|nr:MerR family transcriptional regulator [Ornithinibacillus halotolerans]GGA69963.1 MerR family transcriptional regulator [Ornithinibacillus halotolerans]